MTNKRTAARLVAGIVLAAGVFASMAAPAQAYDTGWNGTRVAPTSDSGWNGTIVKK
jgi:hypothetical protein